MYGRPYPFSQPPGSGQDGYEDYNHRQQQQASQAFFSSVRMEPDEGEEQQVQMMTWNHAPALEVPGLLAPQPLAQQLREEIPCAAQNMGIKMELEEPQANAGERVFLQGEPIQYYNPAWPFWPGNPSTSYNHPKKLIVPASNMNPGTSSGRATVSPKTPGDPQAADVESSHCDSAPMSEAAKEGDSTPTNPEIRGNPNCSDAGVLGTPTQSEMEQFAREVKQKRVSMGFTQADVGFALGYLHGKIFSQTTICRFESLQLSFKNMCQLKPLLERWLEEADKNENLQAMISREQALAQAQKRKRRTNIKNIAKDSLEIYFMRNPKPNAQEMVQIAHELEMDKDVVRVWFCNRRQRDKRLLPKEYGEDPNINWNRPSTSRDAY